MKRTHFVKGFSVVVCGAVGIWACGIPPHIVESSPSRNATTCEWTLNQVSNDSVGGWQATNLYLPMDVNGDKKTDLVVIWDNGGEATAQVSPSNGTAFVQSSNAAVGGWAPANTTYLPMDVNGDGKSDLVVVWDNGGTQTAQVSLSNGTAFNQVSNAALGGYLSTSVDLPMDVNGDGKADLVVLWDNDGVASAEVNVSNGTGFGQVSNAAVGTWNTAGYNLVGDVNGDGKADLVRILPSGTNAVAEVWLSNGTGFAQASSNVVGGWPATGTNPNTYELADVNGDGKADLVILWPNGANTDAQVSISNGTAFSQVSNDSLGPTVAGTQTLFEDVNDDGKIDLVQIYPSGTTTEAQVWVSNGTSFASNSITAQGGWNSSFIDLPMAVSGAGAGGLVVLWQDTTQPVSQQARAQISIPACNGSGSSSGTTSSSTGTGSTTSGSGSGSTTSGSSNPIGPSGGSVPLLHFGVTGDTRPNGSNAAGLSPADGGDYPTAVINEIADNFKSSNVQFVLDLGDHMNNWNSEPMAAAQMALYQAGMAHYPGQWFLTMGNHECDNQNSSEVCIPEAGQEGETAGNFVAFLAAVEKTGVGSLPWYSFDVQTSLGKARFVVVADNAWCSQQETWLTNVMSQTDAKYTIVARHHPLGDTSNGDPTSLAAITTLLEKYPYALMLTGHVHEYLHTAGSREVIAGIAGAPLGAAAGALSFYGYLIIDQLANGDLQVTAWDVTTGLQMDQWSVSPN